MIKGACSYMQPDPQLSYKHNYGDFCIADVEP